MATLLREPGPVYNVRYDKVPLDEVANSERNFPANWITPDGTDVTDDFVRYARPLDRRRLAEHSAHRRPGAARAAQAAVCRPEATEIHPAGGPEIRRFVG